jgi:hypothetical protein
MTITARQVVVDEIFQWLESNDYLNFTQMQYLEELTRIWEYGKWCAIGAKSGLGIAPQIKFRGSRPETTAWDGIANISDDEGMRIAAATVGLPAQALEIIDRIYMKWESTESAHRAMRMRRERFYNMRRTALEYIAANI